VFGQVGYWTAGRLQHDAVLTHPFKRLHNRRFKHASAPPAVREAAASAEPDRVPSRQSSRR
jgi:hypothetical protein